MTSTMRCSLTSGQIEQALDSAGLHLEQAGVDAVLQDGLGLLRQRERARGAQFRVVAQRRDLVVTIGEEARYATFSDAANIISNTPTKQCARKFRGDCECVINHCDALLQ